MLPDFIRVRQLGSAPEIKDVRRAVTQALDNLGIDPGDLKGSTVGITAGSRGIRSYPDILRAIADWIKARGGSPVIIPAMGSHGGAAPEGRKQVLDGLGITALAVGAPIVDTPEFETLGETAEAVPVHVSAAALQVDRLLVVNRVKEHTDFAGEIESGIQKMMAIGLGGFKGCSAAHVHALRLGMEKVVTSVAGVMLEKLPVLAAVGIVENYRSRTALIEALEPTEIQTREKALLAAAKAYALKLPFDAIDVLIVGELGKNISGAGMDTKVIGRLRMLGQKEPETPRIGRIVVLSLTPETHGNALGLGVADITTRRVLESYDRRSTVINALASLGPEHAAIPCTLESDRDAILAAVETCGNPLAADVRAVYIRNTLALENMAVSKALIREVDANPRLEITGMPEALVFDDEGNLVTFDGAV